jgi:hypothetical protein
MLPSGPSPAGAKQGDSHGNAHADHLQRQPPRYPRTATLNGPQLTGSRTCLRLGHGRERTVLSLARYRKIPSLLEEEP